MVKVFEERFPIGVQGNRTAGMYMDGTLKSNLDVLKDAIKSDWDGLIITDGVEGSGKSVLTQQCALYCDPSLVLERIVFTPEDFRKAVLNAKKYQAIIYDEAYGGLSSRKTMSETNHAIVSMLTEIRQKNLFLFIVLPTFFDLDKYVALWRSRALIHVYADRFQRGYFKFYSNIKKKELYVNGKKFYNYKCVQPNFKGRFIDFYTVDKETYKGKKLDSARRYEPIEKVSAKTAERNALMKVALRLRQENWSKEQIAALTDRKVNTITKYLRESGDGDEDGPLYINLQKR